MVARLEFSPWIPFLVHKAVRVHCRGYDVPVIDQLKARLQSEGIVTFRVKARPQAQISRFRGPLGEDTFKIDVAATAEGGQANAELVRFLADEFEVSRSQVEIVSGETARLKIIRISA